MAVSKDMAIYVKDLLMEEEMNGARLISGEEGLDNEIKGVTIIEAPDIVKWINGGERDSMPSGPALWRILKTISMSW